MSNPTQTCSVCHRQRNVMLHMRADFPPDAAKKWLRRTCGQDGKPCKITYMAGVHPALLAQARDAKDVDRG